MGNTLNDSFVTFFFTIKLHFHKKKNSGNLVAHLLYMNFMLLHCAIWTLIDRGLVALKRNVTNAQPVNMTYNIHNLLHLASDAWKYGALDDFNAIKFENHITYIKRLIRKFHQPLQQIQRRLAERHMRTMLPKRSQTSKLYCSEAK